MDNMSKAYSRDTYFFTQLLAILLNSPRMSVKFGCAKSVLWKVVHQVVDGLLVMNKGRRIIQWPPSATQVIAAFAA